MKEPISQNDALADGVGFLIGHHTFKMTAMTSAASCPLASRGPVTSLACCMRYSSWSIVHSYLLVSRSPCHHRLLDRTLYNWLCRLHAHRFSFVVLFIHFHYSFYNVLDWTGGNLLSSFFSAKNRIVYWHGTAEYKQRTTIYKKLSYCRETAHQLRISF